MSYPNIDLKNAVADEDKCPKPSCGRPESAHRFSAGKRLSICGNGHSWNKEEIREHNRKAREAAEEERKPLLSPIFDEELFRKQIVRSREQLRKILR